MNMVMEPREQALVGQRSHTPAASAPAPASRRGTWAGRIIGGLPALFLLMDGAMKLAKPEPVVKATVELGFRESSIVPIGIVLLASTVLYLVPSTAVLGAILLTGYLGGAVATHVHAGQGAFSILFPVLFGALLWTGLYLRDARLRALVPLRR
ncbi:MAG TPA: DoxX family protein [Tepidisphaeraceae bacterium]|nr:DoxX family protein [Tepidisphaeraceae bacterium]